MSEQSRLNLRDYPRSWTSSEIGVLRENAHLGADAVALLLGRTRRSVVSAASRLRISLRPRGERRGHVLGQARAGSMHPIMRDSILSGEADVAALERRTVEIALGDRERPVCPACSARPQDRKSTGLCEVCHLRALAQAHRENQAKKDAQRELWRARQEASRRDRGKGDQITLDDDE